MTSPMDDEVHDRRLAIEAEIAAIRRKIASGELSPPPTRFDADDPFGRQWDWLLTESEADSFERVYSGDRPGELNDLKCEIVYHLNILTKSAQHRDTRFYSNRSLVEWLEDTLFGGSVPANSAKNFYSASAEAMEELLKELCHKSPPVEKSAEETMSIADASSTTLVDPGRRSQTVLKRLAGLDSVRQIDELSATIFGLAEFAGRTPEEIAVLLSLPFTRVQLLLEAATTEVSLRE